MAKRIKVKGKTPRGLSKAQRMEKGIKSKWSSQVRSLRKQDQHADVDPALEHVSNFMEPGEYIYNTKNRRKSYMGGQSKPSSTRKKLVKEGNRKFVGPRRLRSEIGEDVKARGRDLDYIRGKSPMDVVDYMLKNTNYRQPKKLRAPERRRLSLEDYDITHSGDEHSYGLGGIAKNPKLKRLLMRLMDRHLGGGQEFDEQD